ncbi:MAG TPA: HdeD family acid-resistance protein [Polyangiaceae bacterium]|nr:HdeD family acid-resistance protein [Polyangiaceae bacterium]
MMAIFARSWKSLAWRGALGVSFGIIALLWPGMTLSVLAVLFGVYALADGIAAIAFATRSGAREHSWAFLLEGLAGVGVGLAVVLWMRVAIELFAILIAFWALATGGLELLVAARLRGELPGALLLGVGGTISLLLGCAILFWPTASALVLVLLLGSYALVFGAAQLAQALRLRRALRQFDKDDHDFGANPRAV